MSKDNLTHALTSTVEQLSQPESLNNLCHRQRDGYPLPSGKILQEIIDLSRAILFPGYYGKASVQIQTLQYYIGVNVERFQRLLEDQILAGLRFCEDSETTMSESEADEQKKMARELSFKLLKKLPEIREKLSTDVIAAYNGDPASESQAEIIACYPIIKTLANYRIAHELYLLKVPLIPRMMTEMAHSETGIDIHPGAQIGRYFTIDHGTGVVIGATCMIGDNVKIYQGVTLGAKSFPLDEHGNPVKSIPRHPIIENNVIIYANATILGRVTIGQGSVIGANVWVTEDLAPETKKYKKN